MNEDEGVEEGGIYRKVWLGESATILRVGLGKIDNAKCPSPQPSGRVTLSAGHQYRVISCSLSVCFATEPSCHPSHADACRKGRRRKLKNCDKMYVEWRLGLIVYSPSFRGWLSIL
jgi:hypothetical protein